MTQQALGHCVFLWAHSLLSANLSCVQNGHVDNVTLNLWYIEVLKFSTCFQSFKNYAIDPYFQSHDYIQDITGIVVLIWRDLLLYEDFYLLLMVPLPLTVHFSSLNDWLNCFVFPPPMVALFQAKPIYGGWLCLAPEGTDFDNPMQRSRVRTCTTDLDVCSLNVYTHMHTW